MLTEYIHTLRPMEYSYSYYSKGRNIRVFSNKLNTFYNIRILLNPEKPLISVIITAYNRDRYLETCLQSVLNQTIDRDICETIVIKNFESPVDKLAETENVRIIHSDIPEIGPKLFQAVGESRGDLIAFMDDDDLWEPQRLEMIMDAFRKNTELGFFHNSYTFIDENGQPVTSSFRSGDAFYRDSGKQISWKQTDPLSKLHRMRNAGAFFNMSCIVIRRAVILKTSPELPKLNFSPDFFVFFAALCSGMNIMTDPSPLTLYRIAHNGSDFKPKKNDGALQQRNSQLKDRQLLLEMSEKFGNNSAISMAKFELTDFLVMRFIRKHLSIQKGIKRAVIHFLRENRHLTTTLLLQWRYLYKNIGVLIAIFISPRLARFILDKKGGSLIRETK